MKRMTCSECGSDDVLKDAYAAWNFEKQQWELFDTYDKGSVCETCRNPCKIIEETVQ